MVMTEKVIKLVGKRMWGIMCKTGYIENPDCTTDIPSDNLDYAYRAAKGIPYYDWVRDVPEDD